MLQIISHSELQTWESNIRYFYEEKVWSFIIDCRGMNKHQIKELILNKIVYTSGLLMSKPYTEEEVKKAIEDMHGNPLIAEQYIHLICCDKEFAERRRCDFFLSTTNAENKTIEIYDSKNCYLIPYRKLDIIKPLNKTDKIITITYYICPELDIVTANTFSSDNDDFCKQLICLLHLTTWINPMRRRVYDRYDKFFHEHISQVN